MEPSEQCFESSARRAEPSERRVEPSERCFEPSERRVAPSKRCFASSTGRLKLLSLLVEPAGGVFTAARIQCQGRTKFGTAP